MLSPELIGGLGFLAMFIGLAMGIHIGVALAVVGLAGLVVLLGFSKTVGMVVVVPYFTVASYTFITLPMFILMGELAFQGGLGTLIYTVASKWLGRLYGGLAMATAAASALFAAVTGSSMAATATFGKLAVPEMMRHKYDSKLAAGVVAASGTMAALIPPSGMMVIYCILTEVSLAKVMLAGFIPGILEAVFYMALIYLRVRINPHLAPRVSEQVPWKERLFSARWLSPIAVVIIAMLGGIYMGVFTPTEAGAIGAFVVFVVVLVRRSLTLNTLKTSVMNTVRTTGVIFLVLIGAMVFGKFLTLSGLPEMLVVLISGLAVPPIVIVVLVLLVYIVLGCVMDTLAMITITVPLFFPLLTGLGFDGVWLGILIIKIIEMAVITPPFGVNVFALNAILGDDVVSLVGLYRGIIPFFFMDVLSVALLVAIPQICLWLPSTMF